ncbi:MAG: enoyl-CoA hydratase [Desulfobacteraceae bacterium]|jgi:enoyl-CoA hydratase/carnithine racemase
MVDNEATNDHIKSDIDGHIMRLTLNRPEKKNALTLKMYADLATAISQADNTPEVRVIFLTSSSDCFCSGNDLKDFLAFNQKGMSDQFNPFLKNISQAQTPIVAAVGGPAIGIGTTMLLHCDLVYASPSARFQMPFVNLGLCPEAGSSYLLPAMLGYQRAARLILLGESITAQKALDFGLISAVVEDDQLMDYAWQKAIKLTQQPPESVRLSKSLLKRNSKDLLQEVMVNEIQHFAKRLQTAECAEALTAFFEKRSPNFKDIK